MSRQSLCPSSAHESCVWHFVSLRVSRYLCEILDPLIIARHEMLPLFAPGLKLKATGSGCTGYWLGVHVRFGWGWAQDVKIELQGDEIVFDPPFEACQSVSQPVSQSVTRAMISRSAHSALRAQRSGRRQSESNNLAQHYRQLAQGLLCHGHCHGRGLGVGPKGNVK